MSLTHSSSTPEDSNHGGYLSKHISENATPETLQVLHRLAGLPTPKIDLQSMPPRRVAAVLLLLHLTSTGNLAVTLTTRSANLKSHPGETALPGGRVDSTDESVIAAALREANEEIGLPIEDMSHYGYLGTLEPFLSRFLLIVYPVIFVYLDPAEGLLKELKANEDEVSQIFHLELSQILDSYLQHGGRESNIPKSGYDDGNEVLNYSFRDLEWINQTNYRYHKFENPALIPTPLSGLTADILLDLTRLSFNVERTHHRFVEIRAPGQPNWETLIQWALSKKDGDQ